MSSTILLSHSIALYGNPIRLLLFKDDVEEGEILDDEAFEVGKKQIEAGEIEVKEDRDLRSDKKIPVVS
ncbi:non-specific serine/threonine protein kinase [Trifolium repens]|nr:non-specific serine/threonine protein kinase [Trifolium repens]